MGEGEGPQKGVHLQTRPDVLDQVLARRVAGTTSRAVAGNTRTRSGCCDCARGTSSAACRSRRRWVGCDSTRPPQTSETSTASTSGRARPTWSAGSGCTCAVLRLSSSGAHHHAGRQALHRPAAEGRGRHGTGQPPAGHPEADVLAGHLEGDKQYASTCARRRTPRAGSSPSMSAPSFATCSSSSGSTRSALSRPEARSCRGSSIVTLANVSEAFTARGDQRAERRAPHGGFRTTSGEPQYGTSSVRVSRSAWR